MKRNGFTLLEVLIVALILGTLMSIAIPSWMISRTKSVETTCEANIEQIEQAKQLWIMEQNLSPNAVPQPEDLVPDYMKSLPKTPTGDMYDLGSGDTRATGTGCPAAE
jgi:prepilin-type N-terminal cleavage/methylation domain-containing protein